MRRGYAVLLLLFVLAGCGGGPPAETDPTAVGPGWVQEGIASYYAHKFHGRTTASGETYDMMAMTAAHRTLPFGTRVRVVNKENGKAVVVRINDRGPFVEGRVIDVSFRAAEDLDMIQAGLVRCRVEVLSD
jgi:rare lipoprotein A